MGETIHRHAWNCESEEREEVKRVGFSRLERNARFGTLKAPARWLCGEKKEVRDG